MYRDDVERLKKFLDESGCTTDPVRWAAGLFFLLGPVVGRWLS